MALEYLKRRHGTWKAAAKSLGVAASTLRRARRADKPTKRTRVKLDFEAAEHVYGSAKEAAKALGIAASTYRRNKKRGSAPRKKAARDELLRSRKYAEYEWYVIPSQAESGSPTFDSLSPTYRGEITARWRQHKTMPKHGILARDMDADDWRSLIDSADAHAAGDRELADKSALNVIKESEKWHTRGDKNFSLGRASKKAGDQQRLF